MSVLEVAVAAAAIGMTGCYVDFGLGYGGSRYATGHASVGLIAHVGKVAAVRGGVGIGTGGFRPEKPPEGNVIPGPAVFGGFGRIVGGRQDALVATGQFAVPYGGTLYYADPTPNEAALATRAYVGLGYRHGWIDERAKAEDQRTGDAADADAVPESGSVVLSLGPELFWARSTNSGRSDTTIGAAVSVMFTISARSLIRGYECLASDDDDNKCGSD